MTAGAGKGGPERGRKADPVLTEIIRNGLTATTEEMKTVLMRTAYNPIIYEVLDFTVGLFDAAGNTISISIGLPSFVRGMSETVKAKIRRYGLENFHRGDVVLTNDAYITGAHLNHMTFTVPVFDDDDTLVAFASCMAHWQDVGGTLQTFTTDIYSEGLQMPIVKIHDAGRVNEDIMAIIAMNIRLAEKTMGDLRAQIAAVKMGERRFAELLRKHGRDSVLGGVAAIMDQSEALVRARIAEIPDGTYTAESFLDDDGVDIGRPVPVKVEVTVSGETMTVDLSGVADQVKGYYNSGAAAGRSSAQVALRILTAAHDLPFNDGCFRPLEVILPPGKVISANRPAAMRAWMTYPMTVVDTIIKALAPALPERVAAGHHADLVLATVNGIHPESQRLFIAFGLVGGGWGAKRDEDGASATVSMNDGDTHNLPCEQIEAQFPLRVEAYRLRPDSGGPGRRRGGLGAELEVRALTDVNFNSQIERVHCRPWGLFGGGDGYGNGVAIRRAGGAEETFPNGKVSGCRLAAGDVYLRRAGGGGGYGDPLERPEEDVLRDVVDGYVSPEAARKWYGVVVDPAGTRLDPEATRRQREELRARTHSEDEPTCPTS